MLISKSDDGVILDVRVVPRASRSEIVGVYDGALKVRIAAPPVDGAANAELVKVLAKSFQVGKGDVEIITGKAAKTKRCRIRGVTAAQAEAVLKGKL